MDNEWKYYIKDLMDGKNRVLILREDREAAGHIISRMDADMQDQLRQAIRNMLYNYRQGEAADNALIDDIMRQHMAYCRAQHDNELLKRRHNAVVYRYMLKTALHNKSVAKQLQISRDTLINDIKRSVDELLVILVGVPALPVPTENWQGAVKCLFENLRLMRCGFAVRSQFAYTKWEQERIRGVKATSGVFQCVDKAVQLYEEYCNSCSCREIPVRSLETIKALYMNDTGSTIGEIAELQGVSADTVYADQRMAIERFSVLFEYIYRSAIG